MTVGLPPDHEVTLLPGQLKSRDLRRIIHNAYGGDESMAMLTQVPTTFCCEQVIAHDVIKIRRA